MLLVSQHRVVNVVLGNLLVADADDVRLPEGLPH